MSIVKTCRAQGCGRRATHELFDNEGFSRGFYCEEDAKHEKKRLEDRLR